LKVSRRGLEMLDVGLHERRRAQRTQDPEYRAPYEREAREVAETDAVIRQLDVLWADLGMSKAEPVRRVNRNASSVRRLSTAGHVRPELALLVALAERSVPSCVSFRSLGRSGSSSRVRDVCAALSVDLRQGDAPISDNAEPRNVAGSGP
jgi:hypothetical protein